MIPKIEFRYSWIYDQKFANNPSIKNYIKKAKKKYPSQKQILNYTEKVEKDWEKVNKKILKELEKVTGLKWKENKIICYVVGACIPFSDPLTISTLFLTKSEFIDTLIHELIHQIFTQENNFEKKLKNWRKIEAEYKTENFETRIHIPVHAVHKHIYLKYFNKKRLKRDYDNIKHILSYKKSWDIVNKEGHENIIKKLKEIIK